MKNRIIPVFIPHAGCVHTCVFCNQNRISGVNGIPAIQEIRGAADSLKNDGCPAELAFYGGSFTALPEERQIEFLAAAKPFLASDPSRSIRVSTRPDYIDEATVARLKRYGVKTVELGAQSMCDDVLAQSQRGHTAKDTAQASELIKRSGLSLILQMMTGLPGDTHEKSLYTASRFIELKPDGVRIYPTVVVRGTGLFEMWQSGQYHEHSIDEAVELCAEICALFMKEEIPIIRLGLNPTDALSSGDAAAGAYHPAFGELVYSRMYYDKATALMRDIPRRSSATITVPKGCTSIMIGQNRENVSKLKDKFALQSVRIVESNVKPASKPGEIHIEITS